MIRLYNDRPYANKEQESLHGTTNRWFYLHAHKSKYKKSFGIPKLNYRELWAQEQFDI